MASANYFVFDARNENETGPYTKEDANKMASDLNVFVYQNGIGAIFGTPANQVKITGPFYVREHVTQ